MKKYRNPRERRAYQKIKFFRHLRTYIVVNFFMLLINIFDGEPFGWMPVIFLWGIGLGLHYLKVFGLPGSGIFSRDWEQKLIEKEIENLEDQEEELEDFGRLKVKEKRKSWDEKDLV